LEVGDVGDLGQKLFRNAWEFLEEPVMVPGDQDLVGMGLG
jgi:hypothetical protein